MLKSSFYYFFARTALFFAGDALFFAVAALFLTGAEVLAGVIVLEGFLSDSAAIFKQSSRVRFAGSAPFGILKLSFPMAIYGPQRPFKTWTVSFSAKARISFSLSFLRFS
jgi:hypothetical protein